MEVAQFISIGIVGVSASVIVAFLKKKYGTNSNKTKALVVTLSLVTGIGFYFLFESPWYQQALMILGAASTFYGFFIRK
jgi:hypothetical protein